MAQVFGFKTGDSDEDLLDGQRYRVPDRRSQRGAVVEADGLDADNHDLGWQPVQHSGQLDRAGEAEPVGSGA